MMCIKGVFGVGAYVECSNESKWSVLSGVYQWSIHSGAYNGKSSPDVNILHQIVSEHCFRNNT